MGYLILMTRTADMVYSAEEQASLLSLLTNTPGVSNAQIIGVHPKGGYDISCSIRKEEFEQAMIDLHKNGWLSVI